MENRIYKISDFAKSNDDAATKTPVFSTDKTGGVVWTVKPGQTVAKHIHTTSDDVWICMQGEGVFYPTPDSEVPIKAGDVILNKNGECHGMKNTGTEDFIFFGVLAPFPSDFQAL